MAVGGVNFSAASSQAPALLLHSITDPEVERSQQATSVSFTAHITSLSLAPVRDRFVQPAPALFTRVGHSGFGSVSSFRFFFAILG